MSLINANHHTNTLSQLAMALIASVQTVRDDATFANITKKTHAKEISHAINSVLNANFKVIVDPNDSFNAYVQAPRVDKNSPLWRKMFKDYAGDRLEESARDLAKMSSSNVLTLFIDKETGKYQGELAEIEIEIGISWDLCVGTTLTPSQTAAVIAHEVGHADTMFKSIAWTVRSNIVLNQFHRILMSAETRDTKVEMLTSISTNEQLPLIDRIPWLVEANDPNTASVIALGASMYQQRKEMGGAGYEARNFEALADAYATRQGLGNDLIIALSKLPGSDVWVKGSAVRIASHVAAFAVMMFITVSTGGLGATVPAMLVLAHDPEDKIYDDPGDRVGRIIREQITSMQQRRGTLTSEEIEKLKSMQQVAEMYAKQPHWIEALNEALTPSGRHAKAMRTLQQSLEKFAANPLYTHAAELETLA